ncbi:MAG: S1 RNA-binding domain-containing protein [Planctomycetota bacterium]
MITEAEKVEPAVVPAAEPVALAPAPAAAPAEVKPAPAPAARGGKPKKKPGGGGPGGMPNRRMIDDVPMLRDHSLAPKLNDIDAEIAGELEAAMGEINQTAMIAGNTSREVRQETGGSRKKGKILAIHGPDVFIDVPGGRGQGVMQLLQFGEEVPKVGDEIEFSIAGFDGANGVLLLARQWAATQADWSSIAEGMIVEARVLASNKGGLTVDVNGIKGFLPISQIDLYRVEQTDQFINQKFDVIVTEADVTEKNLVVSRRALLEKQREENREKLWLTLELNQIHEGIVRNVKDFGAFIDIGGIDGFLHVSEISWQRQQSAATLLQPGQKVKVAIVKLDKETRKVSVSLKQLEGNPWDDIQNRFPIGSVINGIVTRTAEFGAFVELEPGIEGLVHVSELAGKRVWRVADVAKEGQEVTVKVLSIDPENRRISLSIRQAIPRVEVKPEEDEGEEETVEAKPDRPRNFELRGGLGGPSQLFEAKE